MKAVLISIQPKWVEKIASGAKTIEVRKTRPKTETPFKCYIYCTIGKGIKGDYLVPSGIQCGKVIGEFTCDKIYEWNYRQLLGLNGIINTYFSVFAEDLSKTSLTHKDLENYGKGKTLYGWHISDLKIYDKPKELSEFKAWRDCETPHKQFMNCKFTYRHQSHCEWCQWIKRPPQSWCYTEVQNG